MQTPYNDQVARQLGSGRSGLQSRALTRTGARVRGLTAAGGAGSAGAQLPSSAESFGTCSIRACFFGNITREPTVARPGIAARAKNAQRAGDGGGREGAALADSADYNPPAPLLRGAETWHGARAALAMGSKSAGLCPHGVRVPSVLPSARRGAPAGQKKIVANSAPSRGPSTPALSMVSRRDAKNRVLLRHAGNARRASLGTRTPTWETTAQATPVGFQTTRGDPIGLAGRRLYRSAKVSLMPSSAHEKEWLCARRAQRLQMGDGWLLLDLK